MSLGVALLVVVAFTGLMIGLMLVVRRFAPPDGFFQDSQRAVGVFAVIGTAFSVLLAFVIVVAFQSYHTGMNGAQAEASAVRAVSSAVALFPDAERRRVQRDLICYADSVIDDEWPAMADGHRSDATDARIVQLQAAVAALPVESDKQNISYSLAQDEMHARELGRDSRMAEAPPFVPPLIWVVILLGAAAVLTCMLSFTAGAERKVGQAILMAAVAVIVISGLLVVNFLDRPYQGGAGTIQPTAMEDVRSFMNEQFERDTGAPVRCPALPPV
jgi:hypothetical protein